LNSIKEKTVKTEEKSETKTGFEALKEQRAGIRKIYFVEKRSTKLPLILLKKTRNRKRLKQHRLVISLAGNK